MLGDAALAEEATAQTLVAALVSTGRGFQAGGSIRSEVKEDAALFDDRCRRGIRVLVSDPHRILDIEDVQIMHDS